MRATDRFFCKNSGIYLWYRVGPNARRNRKTSELTNAMKRLTYIALTTALASGMLYRASAAAGPANALYQIISGNYIECCGIGGDVRSALPNESQRFVKLTIDS